jgi:hypothetical protein
VLRKRFFLGENGHRATVHVNGEKLGTWNLERAAPDLPGGLREAVYVIPRAALPEDEPARVTLRYPEGGNTCGWHVFVRADGGFPLTSLRPLHAAQNVSDPRPGRNVIGGSLAVGETSYDNGVGVFAKSLLEYPLNGQFETFTAEVGVDAVTEGKGSVVFEVYADGEKRFSSDRMSGLDAPQSVQVDVSDVARLRLIVGDAGDGNANDVAVWGDARLAR